MFAPSRILASSPEIVLRRIAAGAVLVGCTLAVAADADAARRPQASFSLPDGLELVVAAAPPLANYPIMGCLDDRGRLFIGDAAGLNLNQKGLEEKLPNRVVMLEDTNGDGVFDKSTVFADKMTFPQGACWLDGSLYVASPPGIWKLTDTNGDGVADQREMIVGGFQFTGNAADVHGPFLHPTNGRLYWCHGRKGHKVVQKDGTLVHSGMASGIWSCRPDGSDVQWHSLGCMDNPVEVDFTADGEMLGVVNIYYSQPRGDTLMHWLYGGAYERPDQLQVIAELPRTLEHMPVVHNFGHVAVSGFTRYRSGALNQAWKDDLFVVHFNTQKLVRVKLAAAGATYTATEHEFLKYNDPDAHLTDVIEDADGSLLVLDTGGWFRLGCPSSLIEKPDLRGAVYRVRNKNTRRAADPYGAKIAWDKLPSGEVTKLLTDDRWMVREKAARVNAANHPAVLAADALMSSSTPRTRLRALEVIAKAKQIDPAQRARLLAMLGETLDPALEHAAMFAAIATRCCDLEQLRQAASPALTRRLLLVVEQTAPDSSLRDAVLGVARRFIDADDAELARTAIAVVMRNSRAVELSREDLQSRLAAPRITRGTLSFCTEVATAHLAKPAAQDLITAMLNHARPEVRQAAWRVLAQQHGSVSHADWLSPLEKSLAQAMAQTGRTVVAGAPQLGADLPLLLEAVATLRSNRFDPALKSLAGDASRPQPIRLRALAALSRPGEVLSADTFAVLLQISKGDASSTSRVDATRFLARSRLSKEQMRSLASALPAAGPIELRTLLPLARKTDPATGRVWAESLVQSPAVGSIEESVIRSAFSSVPADVYEGILAPVVRKAAEANEAKKRRLETLAVAAARGRPSEGARIFQDSACAACHQVGSVGRAMGPDLSHLGKIRQPRDVLESIMFPSATLARDYETHIIETADGQTYMGVIKRDVAEGLMLLDVAGQEKNIPHGQIVANTVMTTSLMPMGLEQVFSEQELLDLVAWFVSLK